MDLLEQFKPNKLNLKILFPLVPLVGFMKIANLLQKSKKENTLKALRIGRIPWLVCAPYFHGLKNNSNWYFQDAPPSKLNQLLLTKKIDLAPTSSFLYGFAPQDFCIIPGISTSGPLEVQSVALFCRIKYNPRVPFKLWSTPDSGTSVRLLKLILEKHLDWTVIEWEDAETADGCLYIGDDGLKARKDNQWSEILDLATLWQDWTGYPFVFGLWLVRKELLKDPAIKKQLLDFTNQVRNNVLSPIKEIINQWEADFSLPCEKKEAKAFLASLDYKLDLNRLKSLKHFYSLCYEQGWIESIPELDFLS
jgi:chorismate dehydratase